MKWGPNGAGKSTTLRILSGFLPPSSGKASIGDFDLLEDSLSARRLTGYLPEAFAAPPELRVEEYLRYRGRLRGLRAPQLRTRLEAVVGQLNLGPRLRQTFGTLSKGFRQRVGLADALLATPKALLLDEPFGGLDPLQRKEFRDLIRDLAKDGMAILFSSHVLPEVEELANRVLILHQGIARAVGTPAELSGHLNKCVGLRIRIQSSSRTFEEGLCALFPNISLETVSDTEWLLHDLEEASQKKLLAWLANRSEQVLEFSPVQPRLEDLFKSMVEGS